MSSKKQKIAVQLTKTAEGTAGVKKSNATIFASKDTVSFEMSCQDPVQVSISIVKSGVAVIEKTVELDSGKAVEDIDIKSYKGQKVKAVFEVDGIKQVEYTLDILSVLRVKSAKFLEKEYENKDCMDVKGEKDFKIKVEFSRTALKSENALLQYHLYMKKPGASSYEIIKTLNTKIEQDTKFVEVTLSTRNDMHLSGAKIAVSFFTGGAVVPEDNKVKNTVRFYNILSANGPEIKSVYWSSQEKIEFGKTAAKQTTIKSNEYAFLHIHTRQMYGKEVKIELYEEDNTGWFGDKYLKVETQKVLVHQNAACVYFSMEEAKKAIYPLRKCEGGDFELFCKVIPDPTLRGATMKQSEILKLKFKEKSSTPQKSTVQGTKKFVIGTGTSETSGKKEKCPKCDAKITKDDIKKLCVDAKGNCMIKNESQLQAAVDCYNNLKDDFKLNTCTRKAHFFSQIAEETNFDTLEENLNYKETVLTSLFEKFKTADGKKKAAEWGVNDKNTKADQVKIANFLYGGRMGNETVAAASLGDKTKDGYKYRGRGYIQLTGKDNYKNISNAYNDWIADVKNETKVDWVKNPEELLNGKQGMAAAMTFWKYENILSRSDMGTGEDALRVITYKINGGFINLDERRRLLAKAVETICYKDCVEHKRRNEEEGTVVIISGVATEKMNGFAAYPTYVYRGMTLDTYKKLKKDNKLPDPDYTTRLGRDAHQAASSGVAIKHSDKRYGSNNECPPGEYYLNSKADSGGGGKYRMYLSDSAGTRSISGPDGTRGGIAIHQYNCTGSCGCLVTLVGNSTHKVSELLDAIPDLFVHTQLKDKEYPVKRRHVRVILEEREVEEEKWESTANGTTRWRGKITTPNK